MMTGVYRGVAIAALVLWPAGGCGPSGREDGLRVSGARRLMGAAWTITVHARNRAAGEAAIAAGFAEVERLQRILSDYDAGSELSRLSAAAPMAEAVEVGDDLWRVLEAAEDLRRKSGGAFDISVGPLTTLWRQARRTGRLPGPDRLAAARAAVGEGAVELSPDRRAVRLPKPGSRLDAGGIGMGYAADRALAVIAAHGVASALIDASGDVLASGPPPGAAGWRVAVAPLGAGDAGRVIVLAHAAVTTSGDAFQAVEINGVRYSHVVDPRTGIGVGGPAAVTVIAPDATTADALATAASVLGRLDGPPVIAAFPGCAARFAWREGDETRTQTTPGWPADDGQRADRHELSGPVPAPPGPGELARGGRPPYRCPRPRPEGPE